MPPWLPITRWAWACLPTKPATVNTQLQSNHPKVRNLADQLWGISLIAVNIGLLPVTTDTAEALYRVVDAAYEKRSIALSSNLHPAGFDELMPKTIANATVDRLLHHAHIVLTAGDSIRLTQATAGKGVTPLTN